MDFELNPYSRSPILVRCVKISNYIRNFLGVSQGDDIRRAIPEMIKLEEAHHTVVKY